MAQDLTKFYENVKENADLRTMMHAQRWTKSTLQTLGINLPKAAKKAMAQSLPEELASYLNDVWWMLPVRDPNIGTMDFSARVARRAGNTDPRYAKLVAEAVFGAVKGLIAIDVAQEVRDGLSPDVRKMWEANEMQAVL